MADFDGFGKLVEVVIVNGLGSKLTSLSIVL